MKTRMRAVAPLSLGIALAMTSLVGCNSGRKKEPSLRVVSRGMFGNPSKINAWIAGSLGRRMDVEKLQLLSSRAVDQTGKQFVVTMEKHPGEASKYGPFVAMNFNAAGASGRIDVTAKLEYNGGVYDLVVAYVYDEQAHPRPAWKAERVELRSVQ